MTDTTARWKDLARQLADDIAAEGGFSTAAWRDAVEATPRHVFVPEFHVQQPDGTWRTTTSDDKQWLDAVYRNQPLSTALATTANGHRVTVSSSTKPGLMIRMLEALDVHDGHRVLEIGTGTGYNAALLAHRLGSDHVFSVDIGADLVDAARNRLAELGFTPVLAAAHGAGGLPEHAPFDRIIATCSLPVVPWVWSDQLCEDGLVLVDVKLSAHAGNLVLLRRYPDRLEGRFLPRWAGFMAIRDADLAPETVAVKAELESGARSWTRLDPLPWTSLVPWFLAQARMPGKIAFGYQGRSDRGPTWAVFNSTDSSWAAVSLQPDETGRREVLQSGTIAIWETFESAYREWNELGRPDWDRLGLTATRDGSHRVWLDSANSGVSWEYSPR